MTMICHQRLRKHANLKFTLMRVQIDAKCLSSELASVYKFKEIINNLGVWQTVRQTVTELQIEFS